jgi:hypothetical protein
MNSVCGVQFGLLLRVMPREVMQSHGTKVVTPQLEAKCDQFIQNIKQHYTKHSRTNNVFDYKTHVPGERFITINHNADEAWNIWGPRQALDKEGQSQFDSALRQRALEVWV